MTPRGIITEYVPVSDVPLPECKQRLSSLDGLQGAFKHDPREFRVFAVVSRQVVIDSAFSTVICAPVYSRWDELSTPIPIGTESGLKHDSAIHCDELVSLPKSMLTNCVGALSGSQIDELSDALRRALDVEE